ncbi:MAG: hypothetical protein RL367_261 [Pseudomonadota bacterium]|jgi:TfoX/Sxy family transcriptional regulator of competence genes
MSSTRQTVDFIIEQMAGAGNVSARPMFGEYGVYCDGKIVALICDDQLFVKPTAGGRAFIGDVVEAPPYRGAKPSLLITGDQCEGGEWLSRLISLSAAELPKPKPKRPAKTG